MLCAGQSKSSKSTRSAKSRIARESTFLVACPQVPGQVPGPVQSRFDPRFKLRSRPKLHTYRYFQSFFGILSFGVIRVIIVHTIPYSSVPIQTDNWSLYYPEEGAPLSRDPSIFSHPSRHLAADAQLAQLAQLPTATTSSRT